MSKATYGILPRDVPETKTELRQTKYMRNLLLNLGTRERKRHGKHFLQSVHCALRIPAITNEALFTKEEQLISKFQQKSFGSHSRIVRYKITTGGEGDKISSISQESDNSGIRFVCAEPKQEIQISDATITLSAYEYEGFEKFVDTLRGIVDVLMDVFGVTEIERVGLRKIDSIIAEEISSYEDACSIFNPAFFGLLRSGLPLNGTVKGTEEAMVLEKDGKTCLLKSRFLRLEKPDKYQAELDFDLIDTGSFTTEQCFSEVLGTLNQLHYDLFMWAVTDVMLGLLNEDK